VVKLTKILKYSVLFFIILLIFTTFELASAITPEKIPPENYANVPDPNSPPIPPPVTQESVIVVVASSIGGTTTPNSGAYNFDYGANITLQASPSSGFRFLYWIIHGNYTPGHNVPAINYPENAATDPQWAPTFPPTSEATQDSLVVSTNPLKIICGYGYTYVYEPVFAPTTALPATSNAIVTLLNSLGGNTNPRPGTYYYLNGSTVNIQATPDSGYDFQYWVAVGQDGNPTTINENPMNINCGYGSAYSYQAMFVPTVSAKSSGGIPSGYLYATIVILAVIAVIGVVAALVFRRR
jgi:hypothetical protein